MAYRFIQENQQLFGVRWLLRRLHIYPNAYYNYLKNKKSAYQLQKNEIKEEITKIYHEHAGVDGYRSMRVFLMRKGICISELTAHKYMNRELKLFSIVRPKKAKYEKGTAHKKFKNLIQQNFRAAKANIKWCTDFTYLYLTDGSTRYNCSIL